MSELMVVSGADRRPADYYWCHPQPTRIADFHRLLGRGAWCIHGPSLVAAALKACHDHLNPAKGG